MEPDCQKFALVVPTLNEAANIEPLLEKVVVALSGSSVGWEILVVDDDSSDGTPNVVKRFAEFEPRVRLLVRTGQRGLAGAITYGWAHTDAGSTTTGKALVRAVAQGRGGFPGRVRQCSGKQRRASIRPF